MPEVVIEIGLDIANKPILDLATIKTKDGESVDEVIEATKKVIEFMLRPRED